MEVTAKAKNIRMSARKVRLVINLVRGAQVDKALDQLKFINKLAVKPVVKLINSALASAEHNFSLERSNMFVKEITADGGKILYRWMPRAHGRATKLRNQTCHIDLVLAEIKDSGAKKAKAQKIEAPVKLGAKPKEDEGVKVGKSEKTAPEDSKEEKGKPEPTVKPEGRRGHGKIEGGKKGFVGKLFQRKSG
jgi:large subunit ribosomal protein L22